MKNIIGILALLSATSQASVLIGKHTCQGTAEVTIISGNTTTQRSAQCEDLSIEVSKNGDEMKITNHYSGCGGGQAHFEDRIFKIQGSDLLENGQKIGVFIQIEPTAILWNEHMGTGPNKKFVLVESVNGDIFYEDILDFGSQIIRHKGTCN